LNCDVVGHTKGAALSYKFQNERYKCYGASEKLTAIFVQPQALPLSLCICDFVSLPVPDLSDRDLALIISPVPWRHHMNGQHAIPTPLRCILEICI
jgi:hypothetical protein